MLNSNTIKDTRLSNSSNELPGFRILGISSSMRENSYSRRLMEITLENTRIYGAETYVIDLRHLKLPVYNPDDKLFRLSDTSLASINEAVNNADAFVLASPDYHGSMSGSIKNFLDYYWKEFAGKVFAYIVASHEKGLTVMDQMHTAVRQCYGWSMPYGLSVNGQEDFNSNGDLVNMRLQNRLKMLSRDLVIYGRIVRQQFKQDLLVDDPNTFAARYRTMN